mmetsp:Transcript_46621/g.108660  ORF Transcript_46621/g.108660 Transcript_46621/m.108660 type:complete len:211 (-) Transcript_46621:1115-1747(-)
MKPASGDRVVVVVVPVDAIDTSDTTVDSDVLVVRDVLVVVVERDVGSVVAGSSVSVVATVGRVAVNSEVAGASVAVVPGVAVELLDALSVVAGGTVVLAVDGSVVRIASVALVVDPSDADVLYWLVLRMDAVDPKDVLLQLELDVLDPVVLECWVLDWLRSVDVDSLLRPVDVVAELSRSAHSSVLYCTKVGVMRDMGITAVSLSVSGPL